MINISNLVILLASTIIIVQTNGLAHWYDAIRCHAHTRLSIQKFCSVENKTCHPVFENAADLFQKLGVEAFVRHSKTGSEGTWWPTATGPKESWHSFVRETGRNLPQEFIKKAHANNQRIILYHYPKTSGYYAETEKGWLNKNIHGHPVEYPRGLGLCVNSGWRQKYIEQLLELVDFGADGLYFDEIPQPYQGCWCENCREKFKLQTGHDLPTTMNTSDSVYKLLLEFTTRSVLEHYNEITRAVNSRRADVANLVSIYKVPAVDNSGRVYESTKLVNSTNSTVAKTEFEIPESANDFFKHQTGLHDHGYISDVYLSMGWSISRDAAAGRPPHTWLPHLTNASQAAAATFALMTYGMVANPDHQENAIPDYRLYNLTYKIARKLNPYLNGTRPVRWAGLFFSEAARNAYLPHSETAAWINVLFPTVSAWETLIRMKAPAGIITDWQLSGNTTTSTCTCGKHGRRDDVTQPNVENAGKDLFSQGYRVIIVPVAPVSLLQNNSLTSFQQAGGKVIYLNSKERWEDKKERIRLEEDLHREITSKVGPVPIQLNHGGKFAHAVPLQSPTAPSSFVVMVTNDYRWTYFHTGVPERVTNASLTFRGVSEDLSVTDVINDSVLAAHWQGNETWIVNLPKFLHYLAVHVQCKGACWS
ncbi:uncharacterized protein LOC134195674 [Corticium candelabrum]|uniref:uncharacterized protein LOC134195674 n=1 Tax=Corticium candelabrum TaxID=121492 RepID=UPI002E26FC45|nr:uncharacterized protein LOC134195674 [Corticium candelabrum]